MSRIPAAVLIAAACAAAPAAAQQAVLLRFTPPVGQVVHYRSVTQTWMQIPGLSSPDTTAPTMTQTMFTTHAVTAMQGSARIVTTTVDSSQRDMPAMAGMMPPGDMFRGLVTTQRIDPLGRVDSSAVTPPPGANPMMADAMRRSAGSGRGTLPLPQQAVRPGDTWSDSLVLPLSAGPGAMSETTFHLTYKLERIEQQGDARVAVISMSGSAPSAGGATQTMGSMNGTYLLDIAASRLVSLTNDMSAQLQGEQGTIPIRVHTVTESLP